MKYTMKKLRNVSVAILLLSVAACNAAPPEPESRPAPPPSTSAQAQALGAPNTTGLVHVSELQRASGPTALLGDDPAAANIDRLRAMVGDGSVRALALGVYFLATPPDPQATAKRRASELRLAGSPSTKPPYASVTADAADGWALRINGESGAEWFVWRGQFHAGHGEPSRLTDLNYVQSASAWLTSALATPTRGVQLYPYKVRHFMNAEADETGPIGAARMYQVGIAFNSAVDDLPVLGAGGKVAVHMRTDGTVVEHETVLRPISTLAVLVTGDEIVGPDAALATVEASLRARSIDPSQYRLARTEFGYLTRGRDGVEGVIAPHYGFVYLPVPGASAKKLVEFVPAFTNASALRLVDGDLARDEARKDAIAATAAPPDRK